VLRYSRKLAMNTIALRPWELAAYMRWKAGGCKGPFLLVRPVKPQPEFHSELGCIAHYIGRSTYRSGLPTKCPFGKPGAVLGIKEAWRATGSGQLSIDGKTVDRPDSPNKVVYRADGWDPGPWQPSSRLPLLAIRHRPTIADIRVVRVGEITAQEAWDAGARCECMSPVPQCKGNLEVFMEHWHKHYPTLSWGWGIFLEGT
jgi:hypothetical protein